MNEMEHKLAEREKKIARLRSIVLGVDNEPDSTKKSIYRFVLDNKFHSYFLLTWIVLEIALFYCACTTSLNVTAILNWLMFCCGALTIIDTFSVMVRNYKTGSTQQIPTLQAEAICSVMFAAFFGIAFFNIESLLGRIFVGFMFLVEIAIAAAKFKKYFKKNK